MLSAIKSCFLSPGTCRPSSASVLFGNVGDEHSYLPAEITPKPHASAVLQVPSKTSGGDTIGMCEETLVVRKPPGSHRGKTSGAEVHVRPPALSWGEGGSPQLRFHRGASGQAHPKCPSFTLTWSSRTPKNPHASRIRPIPRTPPGSPQPPTTHPRDTQVHPKWSSLTLKTPESPPNSHCWLPTPASPPPKKKVSEEGECPVQGFSSWRMNQAGRR